MDIGTIFTKNQNLPKKSLLISSDFIQLMDEDLLSGFQHGKPITLLDKLGTKMFDLIIGNLPFGLMKVEWVDNAKNIAVKEIENWIILFKSLFQLSEEGIGLYYVEPVFWNSDAGLQYRNKIKEHGFHINAVFNAPENFLSGTYLRPLIILISKNKSNELFVAEFDGTLNINVILDNYLQKQSVNLNQGLFLSESDFLGFENYKVSKQLKKLSEQYAEFQEFKLGDISEEIVIGNHIVEKENSIYLSKLGNNLVFTDFSKISSKRESYIQLILKEEIIINDYLVLFFSTEVGKLNLKLIHSSSVIPFISKKDVNNLSIPVPSLELQDQIIKSSEKLNKIKEKIDGFEKEIALFPNNVSKVQGNLDNILNSLDLLNETDKVLALIRTGEGRHLEFKSSLRRCLENKVPDGVIEKMILKTISGFLNSEGGCLLVGVSDQGEVLGLDHDKFIDNDSILKHVKNLLKRDFESKFYDLINYQLINVLGKTILYFECKKSKEPVFLSGEEFYVRSNPATDLLKGKEQYEYIKNHFQSLK